MVPTQSPTSPLEDISVLLDRLPFQACVELTCRLLTSISFLPTGSARHIRGRIWQYALRGQYGIKPCAPPGGMLTECAAESLSWSTFSISSVSIFVSKLKDSLTMVKPSGLPIMSATPQADRQRGVVQPSWSAVVWYTTQCPFRA